MKALLRDGIEFTIGMTIVFESGRKLKTDDTLEVLPIEYEGSTIMMIERKGGTMGADLSLFYSSQAARINEQVQRLERMKLEIDEEIQHLLKHGSPQDLYHLKRG